MECPNCKTRCGHDQRICPSCGAKVPAYRAPEIEGPKRVVKPSLFGKFWFRALMALFMLFVGGLYFYFVSDPCGAILFVVFAIVMISGPGVLHKIVEFRKMFRR